eukprot:s1304_g7.t1
MLEDSDEMLISGDDLTAAFYLFRLPRAFCEYLVLRKPVRKSIFEPGQSGTTLVGLTVLPMGWASAVAVMQNAHRQLALRSDLRMGAGLLAKAEIRKDAVFPSLEECPAWTIYLDDTTIIEKVAKGVSDQLMGLPAEEQQRLRRVYEWWGIPTNAGKALERVKCAERLGALLDGERGLLRVTTKRSLDLLSLGAWLRSQGRFATKALQIYAGKAVHVLQFRRCLFAVMQEIFTEISQSPVEVSGKVALYDEMMVLEALLPVVVSDLKAKIDPVVTASDACESGGGASYAARMSRLGVEELEALMEEEVRETAEVAADFRDTSQKVVVIDLFAGIGGLERALQHAQLKPWFVVAVESDPDCRRCLRRRFPGLELCADIKKVDKALVRKWLRKVPDANGVIAGGGSPCQGLSQLSVDREHLQDPRSALFHDAVRVLKLVAEVAQEEGMWCVKFLENVVPDEEDIRVMSAALGMHPLLVDAQHLSRARRPRLFWLSVPLVSQEEVEVHQGELFDVVIYGAACEPMHVVLEEGWEWVPGQNDSGLRFPTFTRAIKRRKPPRAPAGLEHTPEEARQRWRDHSFRYPPYTYKSEYMITKDGQEPRPLLASEREALMGFERDHTVELARKVPVSQEDKEELEDQRCSALGNSFHSLVVGALFDHALWSFGVKKLVGHHEMVKTWADELKRTATLPRKPVDISVDQDPPGEDPGYESGVTEVQSFAMEKMRLPRSPPSATAVAGVSEHDLNLAVQMVQAFVRRQEYRGSDVRLDVGTLYRPDAFPRASVNPHRWLWHDAHSYPFHGEEHINVLELRALVHCVEWRLRRSSFNGVRFLHLCDSQVALSVAVKGRSSSRQLNKLLRRLGAMATAAGRPTQASRRAERQKVGSLSKLVIQPKTHKRYEASYEEFCKFHQLDKNFSLPEFHLFDEWVADFVEHLWESGRPKSEASYVLAAIQFFRPQTKHHLVWSWKLVKTWNQVELPTRATPFSAEVLLSIVGQAFHWKQTRMGWLLILGFSAFLRTSELLHLERREVVLPSDGRPQEAVLLLQDTKGTKKNLLPLDKVVLQEKLALQALDYLCRGLQPGDTLSQQSNHQFRTLFRDLLQALQLHNDGYAPYSLRRGGVTSAYRLGIPLDVLVTQGRHSAVTLPSSDGTGFQRKSVPGSAVQQLDAPWLKLFEAFGATGDHHGGECKSCGLDGEAHKTGAGPHLVSAEIQTRRRTMG